MGKNLSLAKWIPAFLYTKAQQEDLADGLITPAKLDREYVESTFGREAQGQPPSILGRIKRLWLQDGNVYGESEDEF